MDIDKALGGAIRQARMSVGLSQEALEGVSRTYISVLELGKKSARVEKVDAIARGLKLHPLSILALTYADLEGADLDDLLSVVKSEIVNIRAQSQDGKKYGYLKSQG